MIEDDDVVEKEEARVGDAVFVRMRIGNALAPAGRAVAKETDGAAEEGRQRGLAVDAERSQLIVQHAYGIACQLIEAQAAARLEADERVAADVRAALHAFEEERFSVARQCRERRHRRDGVGAQLARDRNDVVILA